MESAELAQALGIPLFHTSFFMPQYPDGQWGEWRLSHIGMGIVPGYYTRQWLISGAPVLARRHPQHPQAWDTWMSLMPSEIESQEPACHYARGHTVIMGLGMGWIALNVALNPAVARVTVVERDPQMLAFFQAIGVLAQVAPEVQAKIHLVEADALTWRPEQPVDFLFADIWRDLGETNALADVRAMQRQVRAATVYYWGQELRLYLEYQRRFGAQAPLQRQRLEACVTDALGLPLLLPWDMDYLELIQRAVDNRLSRGLPLEYVPGLAST
jgi:hypothetical protein